MEPEVGNVDSEGGKYVVVACNVDFSIVPLTLAYLFTSLVCCKLKTFWRPLAYLIKFRVGQHCTLVVHNSLHRAGFDPALKVKVE